MRTLMLILVMLISALLTGCDDTATPEKDEDFILAVMVLDAGGQPMRGMSVGRLIKYDGFDPYRSSRSVPSALPYESDTLMFSYPNPFNGVTTVRFLAAGTREARLHVSDWRGRELKTLLHGRINGGMYSVEWDQRDGAGERVINGVYRFCLSLADTLEPHRDEYSDSAGCTVIDFKDPNRMEIGVSDQTGFFSTRDLDLFPSLQGHAPQTVYDPVSDPVGTFSISEIVTIRVSTPPPPAGGWIYHMSRDIELVDGPNYLEFYFVPDDSSGVFGPLR